MACFILEIMKKYFMEGNNEKVLIEILNILETSEPTDHLGLMGGEMGKHIFYANLYLKTKDEKYLHLVEDFLVRAINDKHLIHELSFSNGLTGLVWFIFFLHKNNILDALEIITDEVVDEIYNWTKVELENANWDYLNGGLGPVLVFGEKHDKFRLLFENIIKKQFVKEESGLVHLTAYNNKKIDLGLAHGLTSILYYFVKFNPIIIEEQYISGIIKTIQESALFTDKMGGFPYWYGYSNISRLGWCYGDLSTAYIFSELEDKYNFSLNSKEIILNTLGRKTKIETGIVDPFICHGSIGISWMYNKVNKKYNNPKIEKALHYWEDDATRMLLLNPQPTDFKETSLLEGISGVGLCLLNIDNKWDECLLLS